MTRTENRLRTPAMLMGGAALIAMGIIGAVAGGGNGAETANVSGGSMSTGETTTVTFSGTIAPVVAKPVVKATPFGEG